MASIAANLVGQGKKVIGIGRNYLDHVKELKNQVPSKPFFFFKNRQQVISLEAKRLRSRMGLIVIMKLNEE
ncbi:hypothetical protein MJO29_016059 [Puccinia striiformis f. sp. tritici]|uniref:hypothetical protein n=1 Tax=Puccinia striiformis f. sp. tritici TaxID=168172 RepID=UPI00200789CE|nr:hypothetical protein Pst134EA_030337 [Puccinia striiformis f. sp. tritici]KAH9446418.1 hypothetical protein Pst134EA_030337 [Puccinia striiformis f. sp. tritici]KAI7934796.1 hypothetical protein MJO29_016059 [Puccinia striiformis f. sp. tritici]